MKTHRQKEKKKKKERTLHFLLPMLSHLRDPDNRKHNEQKYRFVITIICCRAKGRLCRNAPSLKYSQNKAPFFIDFWSRTTTDKCN